MSLHMWIWIWILILTLTLMPLAYHILINCLTIRLVNGCAEEILEDKAMILGWPAESLQTVMGVCQASARRSLQEISIRFGAGVHELIPSLCREIRDCLDREVDKELELVRASGRFLKLYTLMSPVVAVMSLCSSALLAWIFVQLAEWYY